MKLFCTTEIRFTTACSKKPFPKNQMKLFFTTDIIFYHVLLQPAKAVGKAVGDEFRC